MTTKTKEKFVDAGNAEIEQYDVDEDVQEEFSEAQRLAHGSEQAQGSGAANLSGEDSLAYKGGDDSGEESVGGSSPTPDQDVVEELGEAAGLTYEDNEPLHTTEKLQQRDRHRWELDPASSEDYRSRVNKEGE